MLAACQPAPAAPVIPALLAPFFLSRCTLDWLREQARAKDLPSCAATDWRDATAYALEVEAVRNAATVAAGEP